MSYRLQLHPLTQLPCPYQFLKEASSASGATSSTLNSLRENLSMLRVVEKVADDLASSVNANGVGSWGVDIGRSTASLEGAHVAVAGTPVPEHDLGVAEVGNDEAGCVGSRNAAGVGVGSAVVDDAALGAGGGEAGLDTGGATLVEGQVKVALLDSLGHGLGGLVGEVDATDEDLGVLDLGRGVGHGHEGEAGDDGGVEEHLDFFWVEVLEDWYEEVEGECWWAEDEEMRKLMMMRLVI